MDTNAIYSPNDLASASDQNLGQLSSFIRDHAIRDVTVVVPKVVVREICQQRKDVALGKLKKIRSAEESLACLGIRARADIDQEECLAKIDKAFADKLLALGVEVIPIPRLKQNDVIERVISGKKPFSPRSNDPKDTNDDKGFKDYLILQSILWDAKKFQGVKYIFCTKNHTDFDDSLIPEFQAVNKAGSLEMMLDIEAACEYLDRAYHLNLGLRELHQKIKNKVNMRIGELMVQLHKKIEPKANPFGRYSIRSVTNPWPAPGFSDSAPAAYDFRDIEYEAISGSEDEKYWIRATVTAKARYLDSATDMDIFRSLTTAYPPGYAKFDVILSFDLSSESLLVLAVTQLFESV